MLLTESRRAAYVVTVAAALLLAVCNETKPTDAQLALGGTEEISSAGLIGSMQHQTNMAPVVQRHQLMKDQTIANENAPTATVHQLLKANMKREAPPSAQNASAPPASAPKSADSSPAAQQQQATPQKAAASGNTSKSAESSSPAQPSLRDKLKEHLNTASQAVASYSDQLAAQIPKRLRREAQNEIGKSVAQQTRERCIKLYAVPLEPPHNMTEEANQKAKRIRDRCNRYSSPRLIDLTAMMDTDKREPLAIPAPARSRRQAHPSGHSEHGANGNSYEHSYDHSYNHGQSYNNNYGNSNNHGYSNTPAHNSAGIGSSSSSGSQSSSKLAELGEKLNSARQLLQSVRERCAEGYEPTNDYNNNNEHRPQRRERETQPPASSERASKLGETLGGLRNKTNEVRQLVQNVRQQCAESLGNQRRPNDHHQQAPSHVRHRRQAPAQNQAAAAINSAASAATAGPAAVANSAQQAAAGHSNGVQSSLTAFGDQVSKQASAAVEQLTALRDQFVASVGPMIEKQLPKRTRRQTPFQVPASAPSLADINMPPPPSHAAIVTAQNQAAAGAQQHAELTRPKRQIQYPSLNGEQAAPQAGTNGQSSGGILKYMNDLRQQAQQVEAIRQFIQAAGGSSSNQPKSSDNPLASLAQSASSSTSSAGSSVAQVMGQIADLIRSTQDRNSRVMESGQRSVEATNREALEVAKSAQGGAQSTMAEMIQGLQRLASNNPSLLPDIKNLYQTIASRKSSSSSSAAQTATDNGNQLQDQLRKLPSAQS